jgi:4-hydroxyphenylacetate 3-monooxygenase
MLLRMADGREIPFQPRALVVAGFTGRDREVVAAHIEELARHGVPAPDETPTFYPLPPELLTTDVEISVSSAASSGEVEPVLFCVGDRRYVGVGSDHTARDLERVSIAESKAACPKVVGLDVIEYDEAVARWESLELQARTGDGVLYQQGRAGELLPIPELLELMAARGHQAVDGTVVFLGTLGLVDGAFVYADRWTLELAVPGGPTLKCSYDVAVEGHPSEVMT